MRQAFRFWYRRSISLKGSSCFRPLALVVVFGTMALPVAAMAQATAGGTTQATAPSMAQPFGETLAPALQQVGSSLGQIRIDRWKLSRGSKAQVQNDVSSIQQDLSSQLPDLLQAAQTSPVTIGPRLAVLRNVDALYDVLVRVTTTANLSAGKTDVAVLNSALQGLESARKSSADELLKATAAQDQEIIQFRAQIQAARSAEAVKEEHPKTIVVNNRVRNRKKRRKKAQHPKVTSKPNPAQPSPVTGNKPGLSQ